VRSGRRVFSFSFSSFFFFYEALFLGVKLPYFLVEVPDGFFFSALLSFSERMSRVSSFLIPSFLRERAFPLFPLRAVSLFLSLCFTLSSKTFFLGPTIYAFPHASIMPFPRSTLLRRFPLWPVISKLLFPSRCPVFLVIEISAAGGADEIFSFILPFFRGHLAQAEQVVCFLGPTAVTSFSSRSSFFKSPPFAFYSFVLSSTPSSFFLERARSRFFLEIVFSSRSPFLDTLRH